MSHLLSRPRTTPAAPAPVAQRRGLLLGWLSAAALFTVYALTSVQEHRQHRTSGFDLGILVQEVRSYAAGHLPTSTLKGPGFPLLGDHFSPIVALIAPLYRLWPTALTLLLVQAALLAVAVVPLARWAATSIGRVAAGVVVFGYGLSWGIAEAVGFDFHEVAFAVPLLAFALGALGEGRYVAAVCWAAPLVGVKEDLGLTVAAIGVLVALRGRRRLGLLTATAGVLATALETMVLIPGANPDGHYAYTGSLSASTGLGRDLLDLVSPTTKLFTLACLLAPTALLALRSRLLLVAVPTLVWRFLSDNPAYWGTSYHYSAVLMPIVFAAFVDALRHWPRGRGAALAVSALVTTYLVGWHPFAQLYSPGFWHTTPAVVVADRLLAQIPDNVSVAASDWLAPQLTSRDDVSLFGGTPLAVSHAEYVIVDTTGASPFPVTRPQQLALLAAAETDGYQLIEQADGVELLRRR